MSGLPVIPVSIVVPLAASTTTYGIAFNMPSYDRLTIVASLVALPTTTCDVYIQESWDNGTTWVDVGHFTQMAGGSSTPTYRVQVPCVGAAAGVAATVGTVGTAVPTLAANTFVDGPWGPTLRLVAHTGAGTNANGATQTIQLIPGRRTLGAAA